VARGRMRVAENHVDFGVSQHGGQGHQVDTGFGCTRSPFMQVYNLGRVRRGRQVMSR
jgi:hypothetical protein